MCLTKIIIVIVAVIIAVWLFRMLYKKFTEGFDATGTEFVAVGQPRYGLRGDLLRTSPITNNYMDANRNIRLSQSGSDMWEADESPVDDHIPDCRQVACPGKVGYGPTDKCWQCGSSDRTKTQIPDMFAHVPI